MINISYPTFTHLGAERVQCSVYVTTLYENILVMALGEDDLTAALRLSDWLQLIFGYVESEKDKQKKVRQSLRVIKRGL